VGLGLEGAAPEDLSRLVTLVIASNPTDSHAYLTLALHWVEPGEHMVPVVVHHNAQTWQFLVRGEAPAVPEEAIRLQGEGAGYTSCMLTKISYVCTHLHICDQVPISMCILPHAQRGMYLHTHTHTCTCTKTLISHLASQGAPNS
jgi:hypothetical protein